MEPVAGRSNQNTDISYISSRKGAPILVHENRQYRKFKKYKSNGNLLWRCLIKSCKGFLTIDGNEDIIKMTEHTCEPMNSAQAEVKKAIDELRQEAAATDGPIPTLYKSKINKLLDKGLNLVADCPDYKNIKSSLYNKRNRICGVRRLCAKTAGDVQVSTLNFQSRSNFNDCYNL